MWIKQGQIQVQHIFWTPEGEQRVVLQLRKVSAVSTQETKRPHALAHFTLWKKHLFLILAMVPKKDLKPELQMIFLFSLKVPHFQKKMFKVFFAHKLFFFFQVWR